MPGSGPNVRDTDGQDLVPPVPHSTFGRQGQRKAQDAMGPEEGPPPRPWVFKTSAPPLPKPPLGLNNHILISLINVPAPSFWDPFGIRYPVEGSMLLFNHLCLVLPFPLFSLQVGNSLESKRSSSTPMSLVATLPMLQVREPRPREFSSRPVIT